jgi:peptide chain release factor 1
MSFSPVYLKKAIKELEAKISENKKLLKDPTLASLAQEEIKKLETEKASLSKWLETNPSVNKNTPSQVFPACLLEFRPGPGGQEAKLWANDLKRMYLRFANLKGWQVSELRDDVIKITAKNAYQLLKHEAGVHRVQRIPVTEASGRIHTSTASVAVLPEIPESQITIKPEELKISFTHASGHGGQNINKVATAVRLLHQPTGIVVECQSQRSQEQNRKIAMNLLRSKLWQLAEENRQKTLQNARAVIGRAMRSEKIRTYNFPQNRVTDHRLKKSWYNLTEILEGNLDKIIESFTESSPTPLPS